MAEWRRVPLAEIAVERGLVGGPFGSSLGKADYVDIGVPVIRGTNLPFDRRFDPTGFVYVTEEKCGRDLARNTAVPGDVVFTQRGTLGQVGLVPRGPHPLYVISQSQMRLRPDPNVADPEFIYYAFRGDQMVAEIQRNAIATGVPHINLGILGRLQLLLPPLREQRLIASFLAMLDDKIDLNRRIGQRVHDMVRFAWRELVERTDVTSTHLGAVAEVNARVVRAAKLPPSIQYLDISSVRRDEVLGWQALGRDAAPGRARRLVRAGDSVISMVRPGRRSHAWLWRPPTNAVVSTGFAVVSPLQDRAALVYATVTSDEFIAYLESVAEGSAYPAVKPDRVAGGPAVTGPAAVLDKFEAVNRLLLERAAGAAEESRTLATLRDALLPKLMSGELRVREAEEWVEAAG